mmetsp:Transcript_44307/g.139167  ORF Transcript_44307/g.139167 Transcript_44307/m.139167 type:complete len:336 (+) Transcript_44307:214-1221(+)
MEAPELAALGKLEDVLHPRGQRRVRLPALHEDVEERQDVASLQAVPGVALLGDGRRRRQQARPRRGGGGRGGARAGPNELAERVHDHVGVLHHEERRAVARELGAALPLQQRAAVQLAGAGPAHEAHEVRHHLRHAYEARVLAHDVTELVPDDALQFALVEELHEPAGEHHEGPRAGRRWPLVAAAAAEAEATAAVAAASALVLCARLPRGEGVGVGRRAAADVEVRHGLVEHGGGLNEQAVQRGVAARRGHALAGAPQLVPRRNVQQRQHRVAGRRQRAVQLAPLIPVVHEVLGAQPAEAHALRRREAQQRRRPRRQQQQQQQRQQQHRRGGRS